MALKKWVTGDIITERSANNKGVRKGAAETDITGISTADKEIGDLYYNEVEFCHQSLYKVTGTKRTSIRNYLAADATEVTVTGTPATQRKDTSFVKSAGNAGIAGLGFDGNRIFIIAELKVNAGTGSFRVRKNGGGGDELVLTTTSATFEIKTGSFEIEADANGRITLEFFMDATGTDIITNRELEVHGV